MPVIRSRYEDGRSITELPDEPLNREPTDLLRALLGRESTYLARGPRTPTPTSGYSTANQAAALGGATLGRGPSTPAYAGSRRMAPAHRAPGDGSEAIARFMQYQRMSPLPQTMIGAGAGPGFTPAMGPDWASTPAWLRAEMELPVAQAALARSELFRNAMVPTNSPQGGRLAMPPGEDPDERADWSGLTSRAFREWLAAQRR